MQTRIASQPASSLADGASRKKIIVAATRQDLPDCGASLRASKDYQIQVTSEQIVVCGYQRDVHFPLCVRVSSPDSCIECPSVLENTVQTPAKVFGNRLRGPVPDIP
jgi:hypothetical protein